VGYGMLVADGMGGHQAGEIASRLAISTFVNLILNSPEWFMRVGKREAERVMERIAERYRIVDAVVREKAHKDPALAGMGGPCGRLGLHVTTDVPPPESGPSCRGERLAAVPIPPNQKRSCVFSI
jgi:hypothetical protein